jgi:hypothetical protein
MTALTCSRKIQKTIFISRAGAAKIGAAIGNCVKVAGITVHNAEA